MCGIAGYINLSGVPLDHGAFERMVDSMAHRGPDSRGVEHFAGPPAVSLGHRRLAIIDLSPRGRQPMCNEDGTLWIVFNGEIYNYQPLMAELRDKGHAFSSATDTEVILHAYEEWGEACLERLEGMFAFCIHDIRNRTAFLARDHLGIKPLYYRFDGETLLFASELKALLASGLFSPEPDWPALTNPWHYLASPYTGIAGVAKLPAGCLLRLDSESLHERSYWDISPAEEISDFEAAAEELSELLQRAVQAQMIADVPVGAFLSGGLDSSAIVALMSRHTEKPISTFTIRFDREDQRFEAQTEDYHYARQVAKLFGCKHEEIVIRPNIAELLQKMTWHMDEPLSDPAAINTYLISSLAREQGVIVLLNGMGGDELFGGYRKHLACLLAQRYQRFAPPFLRAAASRLARCLPVAGKSKGYRRIRWAKRFLSFADLPPALRFMLSNQSLSPQLYERLYRASQTPAFEENPHVLAHRKYLERSGLAYLTRMCLTDSKVFLPDHNLTYSDKATMAAGIESRPPLIDRGIVEFAFRLAPDLRIRGRTQKALLKKACEPFLPREIIYRPKASFGAPLRSWIRGPLREMIDDLLHPEALARRGYYAPATVRAIVEEDREGKEDHGLLIWTLLSRELWFRSYLDQAGM